jgi:hypothetical protein
MGDRKYPELRTYFENILATMSYRQRLRSALVPRQSFKPSALQRSLILGLLTWIGPSRVQPAMRPGRRAAGKRPIGPQLLPRHWPLEARAGCIIHGPVACGPSDFAAYRRSTLGTAGSNSASSGTCRW